jgi:uncharacterized peroxidase-related enzyme
MAYITTPSEVAAEGAVRELYDADREQYGYVPNFTKVFSLRPEVYQAWAGLNGAIKSGMALRTYELATLAAARRRRSSYCCLAHGKVLRDKFFAPGALAQIADDHHHTADLDPVDVAVMDFADRAAEAPTQVTADDIDALRDVGLSDQDIFDVVLATAARCFFSTVLDAVGAEADTQFRTSLEPELQAVLTVGRPIAATG